MSSDRSPFLFRISLVAALSLLSVLVLLCLAALHMSGNLQVVAQFFPVFSQGGTLSEKSFTMREFSQLAVFSPIGIGPKDKQEIDEMLVRYYLEMRYTQMPDNNEMLTRWGEGGAVYYLSQPSVYAEFSSGLQKRLDSLPDVVKTIEIKNVTRYENRNQFNIDFVIYEAYPDGQVQAKGKNAVLTFVYRPYRRIFSPFFTNPYGLMFTQFEETEKKLDLN